MITIEDLQILFDAERQRDEVVFARLFAEHMARCDAVRRGGPRGRRAGGLRPVAGPRGALMSLPINFLGREFAEARLEIVEPKDQTKKEIPLHFNPADYQLTKANTFAEIPIPGLESPPLQYVRGGSRVLSMDVLVDTSDDPKKSVYTEYVAAVEDADGQERQAARPADRAVHLGAAAHVHAAC